MELKVKLTENQARLVLLEFERIAEWSEDAGYRVQADNICKRIRAAQHAAVVDADPSDGEQADPAQSHDDKAA